MKFLKASTVRKALLGMGFRPASDDAEHLAHTYFGSTIYLHLDQRGNIRVHDGRWHQRSNVHIVSYFAWPRNRLELAKMMAEIVLVYEELCRHHFFR